MKKNAFKDKKIKRGEKVTVFYENTSQIIDLNKINETKNYLKKAYNQIKAKCIELKAKAKQEIYEKGAKKILKLLDEIEEFIDNHPLLGEDELFDFQDLKSMIKYILKDKSLFFKHSHFILDIFKVYMGIVFSKLENKDCKDSLYLFNRKREYFYTHIYESLGIYDDLIVDLVNTLWDDLD